ncbi:MAG: hypothetical protein M3Y54_21605 [Bacteroidota bacterium]|nr:hypothetical protein [Bacteroidota bacterium]
MHHFTKPAFDFPQQLQKLQARSLDVADEPQALRYLATVSYYWLSGYWSSFLTAGTRYFEPGLSLSHPSLLEK